MSVRRVVTADLDGGSTVISDGPAPHTWCHEIWTTTTEQPLGFDPATNPGGLDVAPGATTFRMVELPPEAVIREYVAASAVEGLDAGGFHETHTVDYVLVLDGPVELVLEQTSVVLNPGDCVVECGGKHAWRNHGDNVIRLLTVQVGRP